jgi:DNA-binding MarR family transcriptional regulator
VLDPVIHQAVRLRVMAALQRNREARFTALRDALELTDGNLASHAAVLEKAGYVEARRILTPTGFELRYRITPRGVDAFLGYVAELKALLEAPAPVAPDPPARGAS